MSGSATVRRTLVSGFEGFVLENPRLRAVVIPALGGRVWELEDRIRKRQWIWHRDGVPLSVAAPGAAYDDVWSGGWEELFPNDAPGEFEGRQLPDHGEWWASSWSVSHSSGGDEAVLRIESRTRVRQAACAKEFRLGSDADTLHVRYRIESHEAEPFHFLFKQHLPIALTPSCRLVLPGGVATPVDPTFGTLLRTPEPVDWPREGDMAPRQADLRLVPPPSSRAREFVYVAGVPAGWCGVDDTAAGASLRLRFDLATVPFVWLFLTYGGWRDCYTAVLEPCSNMPKDLSLAVRDGRSALLPARGVFETAAAVTLGAASGSD